MNNRIKSSWNKIEPDEITQKRMLDKILEHSALYKMEMAHMADNRKKWLNIAVCVTLVFVIGTFAFSTIIHQTVPAKPSDSSQALAKNLYATIYIPNRNYSGLVSLDEQCKNNKPEDLIDALVVHKVLPNGLRLNSFSISDNGKEYSNGSTAIKEVGTLTAKIDLPVSLVEYINNLTEKQEKVVIASLINTFIHHYHLESIKVTIDGKMFATNRIDYSGELKLIEI